MSATSQVDCPHCLSVNRFAADRDAKLATCGKCRKPLFDGHPHAVDQAAFDKHVARNDIPVVVDFWAGWCAPCTMMAPAFEAMAAEMEPALRVLKVDTEAETALAARFQIRSIPMLIALRKGAVLAQRAGAMDRGSLRTWLASLPSA